MKNFVDTRNFVQIFTVAQCIIDKNWKKSLSTGNWITNSGKLMKYKKEKNYYTVSIYNSIDESTRQYT